MNVKSVQTWVNETGRTQMEGKIKASCVNKFTLPDTIFSILNISFNSQQKIIVRLRFLFNIQRLLLVIRAVL